MDSAPLKFVERKTVKGAPITFVKSNSKTLFVVSTPRSRGVVPRAETVLDAYMVSDAYPAETAWFVPLKPARVRVLIPLVFRAVCPRRRAPSR